MTRDLPKEIPMKVHIASASVLLGLLVSSVQVAHAQVGQPGRLLASNCFQCHCTNGKGPGFDSLAGKSTNEIYKELKEFQAGKEGNGIMAKHAMAYTDEQLKLISAWFAAQK
jgi:cytochrome c553